MSFLRSARYPLGLLCEDESEQKKMKAPLSSQIYNPDIHNNGTECRYDRMVIYKKYLCKLGNPSTRGSSGDNDMLLVPSSVRSFLMLPGPGVAGMLRGDFL